MRRRARASRRAEFASEVGRCVSRNSAVARHCCFVLVSMRIGRGGVSCCRARMRVPSPHQFCCLAMSMVCCGTVMVGDEAVGGEDARSCAAERVRFVPPSRSPMAALDVTSCAFCSSVAGGCRTPQPRCPSSASLAFARKEWGGGGVSCMQ